MNVPPDPLVDSRGFHLFRGEAQVVKQPLVVQKKDAVLIHYNNMLRKEIYELSQFALVLSKHGLGALEVIDVGIRSIPVDNVARFVAQWLSPKQEPSIHSVEPAQPSLNFTRLARGQKSEPLMSYFLQVLRVNGILPSPAASCFKRNARIFVPSPVPKYSRAIRQATPSECRDGVNDLPEFRFRGPDLLKGVSQCFLRSLSLDRNYGYVTCAFDQSQVSLARRAGLRVVHSERAEHVLAFGE